MLDGACRIDALAERAAAYEQPALGLTDHGVMNGAVEHYKACRKHGIKPILGLEAYFVDDCTEAVRYERNHLTLLAASDEGFGNLVKLSSAGYLEGYRAARRTSTSSALAACERDHRPHRLPAGALLPAARRRIAARGARPCRCPDAGVRRRQRLLRGAEERHSRQERRRQRRLVEIARELGRPLVATGDVHYLRREDYDNHRALCACRRSRRSPSRSCRSTRTSSS